MKIDSTALVDSIEEYLPFLILSNQTAYVEERFISENEKVTDFLKLTGLVVTVDSEGI